MHPTKPTATGSTVLCSDLISSPIFFHTRKIAATVEHRRLELLSLQRNMIMRRAATAIRMTRRESFGVTVPPSYGSRCKNGEDTLTSAAI